MPTPSKVQMARHKQIREAALQLAARGPFDVRQLFRFMNPDVVPEMDPKLRFKLGGLSNCMRVLVSSKDLVKAGDEYQLPAIRVSQKAKAQPLPTFISPPTQQQLMAGRAAPAKTGGRQ